MERHFLSLYRNEFLVSNFGRDVESFVALVSRCKQGVRPAAESMYESKAALFNPFPSFYLQHIACVGDSTHCFLSTARQVTENSKYSSVPTLIFKG